MLDPVQLTSLLYFKAKKTDKMPVRCGKNITADLCRTIKKAGHRSVFIACGNSVRRMGMLDSLIDRLDENGIKTTVFSGIRSDPTISQIEEGLKILKENNCDCVVAAGGGSVLDGTKVIALRATNPLISVNVMGLYIRPLKKSLPLYMIPTTSGTGSEVTYFSVVTDEKKQKKCAIVTDKYMPEEIIFDSELLRHVPEKPTIYAGLDALTHMIEASVGLFKGSFLEDIRTAPQVCSDIFKYLPVVSSSPDNEEARLKMAMAAYDAGINFRRIGVGYVHAIAHRIGEMYHIPHGLACAVVLPHVLRHSMPAVKKDLDELAVKSKTAKDAESFIEAIENLEIKLGIPEGFSEIRKSDYVLMIKRIQSETAMEGCPVKLNNKQLTKILDDITLHKEENNG